MANAIDLPETWEDIQKFITPNPWMSALVGFLTQDPTAGLKMRQQRINELINMYKIKGAMEKEITPEQFTEEETELQPTKGYPGIESVGYEWKPPMENVPTGRFPISPKKLQKVPVGQLGAVKTYKEITAPEETAGTWHETKDGWKFLPSKVEKGKEPIIPKTTIGGKLPSYKPEPFVDESGENIVWVSPVPGETAPKGYKPYEKGEPKLPPHRDFFDNKTGITYRQEYQKSNGEWQKSGQPYAVHGPAPEKETKSQKETEFQRKYSRGYELIKNSFFKLDPLGNAISMIEGRSEDEYLKTMNAFKQNLDGGMDEIGAATQALKGGKAPKPPSSKPEKEGRYSWEGHEWTWTKKEGWKLIK